jgi:general secretion pathway protein I
MFDTTRPHPGPGASRILSEGGFTLLEIMVALAILGGVIVTALVSISYHLSMMDTNMERTFASMLARSKLAEVRLMGRPRGERGSFEAPYRDFAWKYERRRGDYKDIWNETLTVSRKGGATSASVMTLMPEEKK